MSLVHILLPAILSSSSSSSSSLLNTSFVSKQITSWISDHEMLHTTYSVALEASVVMASFYFNAIKSLIKVTSFISGAVLVSTQKVTLNYFCCSKLKTIKLATNQDF